MFVIKSPFCIVNHFFSTDRDLITERKKFLELRKKSQLFLYCRSRCFFFFIYFWSKSWTCAAMAKIIISMTKNYSSLNRNKVIFWAFFLFEPGHIFRKWRKKNKLGRSIEKRMCYEVFLFSEDIKQGLKIHLSQAFMTGLQSLFSFCFYTHYSA